ncbi:MAG: hypothetical protein AAGD05_17245, partial [Bacteroidota bacterium]
DDHLELRTYPQIFSYLNQLYWSLYGTVALVQESIPKYLQQSLEQSNHAPHISLLLAFWGMLGETKTLINQFTQQHLDFYYLRVLQQTYASAVPDQVLLYFQLASGQTQAFLPQGTSFLAGTSPSGQNLLYELDHDLSINQAQPLLFKTLYNGTTNSASTVFATGGLSAAPMANSGDGQGGKFLNNPPSWPTFGGSPNEGVSAETSPTQLGFALTHSIFYLSEGNRQITIVIKLREATIEWLEQEMIQLGLEELDYWEGLELLLNQSLQLTYTGPKGWISPAQSDVWLMLDQSSKKPQGQKIPLNLVCFAQLAATQVPFVAYNEQHHGPGYADAGPVLRFTVRQQVSIKRKDFSHANKIKKKWPQSTLIFNPYPLLSQLQIKEVAIYVDVEDVEQFVVQNDFSVLNPKKPYAPFGVAPVVENHFYLGNQEVFCKPLTFLGIKIQWYDLPQMPNGFCDYYYDYNLFQPDQPFYNSVFKWKLDLLAAAATTKGEDWKPLKFTAHLPSVEHRQQPFNPSVPSAEEQLYTGLVEAARVTSPPETITPEIAQKILRSLG